MYVRMKSLEEYRFRVNGWEDFWKNRMSPSERTEYAERHNEDQVALLNDPYIVEGDDIWNIIDVLEHRTGGWSVDISEATGKIVVVCWKDGVADLVKDLRAKEKAQELALRKELLDYLRKYESDQLLELKEGEIDLIIDLLEQD